MIQLTSEFYSSKGEQFKVDVFAENWEGIDLTITGGTGNTFYVDKDWTCYLRQYQSITQLRSTGPADTWHTSQIWSFTYNEAEDRTEITTLLYYSTGYSQIKNDLAETEGAYGSHTTCDPIIENINTEWEGQGDEILDALKTSSTICTYANKGGGLDRFYETYKKAQDNELKMLIYRDNSGWELEWAGNIVLDLVEQDNLSKPRSFTIKAIDGIRKLKDLPYAEVISGRSPSYYTLIERIQEILAANDLDQFWGASDAYIRESIEFQSDEVVSASALTSPLAYTRAADGLFVTYKEKTEAEVFTYYDALKGILELLSCRIVHSQGMYHIQQVRNYDTSGYSYREFFKSGTTYTLGTHNHRKETNPASTATRSTDAVVLAGGKFGNLPGLYKSSMMTQTHDTNRVVTFVNSYIGIGASTDTFYVNPGTVRGGIGTGATMNLSINLVEYAWYANKIGTYKLRVDVEFQCGSSDGVSGNGSSVSWTADPNDIWVKNVKSTGDKARTLLVFETPEIPFAEEVTLVKVVFTVLDAFGAASSSTGKFYIEYMALEFPIDGVTEPNKEIYVENHLTNYTKELKLDDMIISDLSNSTSIKTLEVQTDHTTTATNWDEADQWDADYSSTGTLAYFRVKEAMSLQYLPPMVYRGKIEGVYYATQSMYYTDFEGNRVTFVMNGMTYNYAMDEYDGEWFEFLGDRTSTADVDVITDVEGLPSGGINGEAKQFESNLLVATGVEITKVSTDMPAGTITEIPIVNLVVGTLSVGDLLTIIDPVTNEELISTFSISATPGTSDTEIEVESKVTTVDVPAGSIIVFDKWHRQLVLGNGLNLIHTNVAGEINGIDNKATPIGADKLLIEDSADSWAKKEINISDLPGSSGAQTIITKTSNYTVLEADLGSFIRVNASSGTTVTLTFGSGLSTGFHCEIQNVGAGYCEISATAFESVSGYFTIKTQYASANVKHIGSGTYSIRGELAMVTTTPLDTYTADMAVSLRLLRTAYTGALIKIRRSSDNAEKDFYPDDNSVISLASEDGSGTSLSTWIASSDGYVVKMYDQTGNGLDLSQTTSSRQPKIVSSGSMVTSPTGEVAIYNTTTQGLETAAQLYSTNTYTMFVSASFNSSGNQNFLTQHDGTGANGRSVVLGYRSSAAPSGYDTFINNGTSYDGQHSTTYSSDMRVFSIRAASDDYFMSINDDEEEIISNQSWTPLNEKFRIGNHASYSGGFDGYWSEFIFFDSDETSDRSDIEQDMIANMIL